MKIIKIALLIICGIVTFDSQAQEFFFTGGMNISNMIDKSKNENYAKVDNYKPRVGGHLGTLIGFNLKEKISFQTGILISTKGFKTVEKEEDEDYFYKEVFKLKLTYLEVPLLASYNFKVNDEVKVFAGIGPVLGIAIGGKYIDKWEEEEDGDRDSDKDVEKISFGNNNERDELKRIDLGLMIQAGVRYDKYKFGVFYNQGLINISPFTENGYVVKNRVFGLSVGYIIDLNK